MPYKVVQLLIVPVYLPPLLLRVRISSTGCMLFGVPGSSSVGVPGSSMTRIEQQGNQTNTKPSSKIFSSSIDTMPENLKMQLHVYVYH